MKKSKLYPITIEEYTHFLYEEKPVRLIGILHSWVEQYKFLGWLEFGFFENDKQIDFQLINNEILMILNLDLALQLSGLFLRLVAQNQVFRKEFWKLEGRDPASMDTDENTTDFSCQIRAISQTDASSLVELGGSVEIRIPRYTNAVKICFEDDQISLTLREELAQQLGLQIIKKVGTLFAQYASSKC